MGRWLFEQRGRVLRCLQEPGAREPATGQTPAPLLDLQTETVLLKEALFRGIPASTGAPTAAAMELAVALNSLIQNGLTAALTTPSQPQEDSAASRLRAYYNDLQRLLQRGARVQR
jgi:hypothetical protein